MKKNKFFSVILIALVIFNTSKSFAQYENPVREDVYIPTETMIDLQCKPTDISTVIKCKKSDNISQGLVLGQDIPINSTSSKRILLYTGDFIFDIPLVTEGEKNRMIGILPTKENTYADGDVVDGSITILTTEDSLAIITFDKVKIEWRTNQVYCK